MQSSLPLPIKEAIENLSSLPGIGSRSAERLVFTLLKNQTNLDQKIAESIGSLKRNIQECEECFHFSEQKRCAICENENRSQKILCIIESPMDLIAIERTDDFKGKYHVLHGIISPINRIRPEDIRFFELMQRIEKQKDKWEEVILALPPTVEGDATSMYITREIKKTFKGKITKLARGIPSGSDFDYLDLGTMSRAIIERREF